MKKGSIDDGLLYHAGFPNAGEDQHGVSLSLDKLAIKHRLSTYFWRLEADQPLLHWRAGTVVVVDRAMPAREGRIVVVSLEDDFVLCRYRKKGFYDLDGQVLSRSATLWGVVTYVLQQVDG